MGEIHRGGSSFRGGNRGGSSFRGGRGGSSRGGSSFRGGRGGNRGGSSFRGGRGSSSRGGSSFRGGRGGNRGGSSFKYNSNNKIEDNNSNNNSNNNNNNNNNSNNKTKNKRTADDLGDDFIVDDSFSKKSNKKIKNEDGTIEIDNGDEMNDEGLNGNPIKTPKQSKQQRKEPKKKNLGDLEPSIEFMSKENQAILFSRKYAELLKLNNKDAISFKEEYFIEPKEIEEDLSTFIKNLHPLLDTFPDKKKYKVQNGAPLVVIATCSATRAIGISKVLSDFNIFTKVGLFFAKHKKIEEHIEACNKFPYRIAVGTPNRLHKLAENGCLKLKGSVLQPTTDKKQLEINSQIKTDETTRYLVVDKSFKTLKGEDLFRISGEDFFEFFNFACKDLVLSGQMKIAMV